MIPNLISLSRLVLAAAFVHYVAQPIPAIALVCAAGISDWLDGFAAKRLGQHSRFGALLDPICDRAFAVTVLATLWWVRDVPFWQVGLLATRDLANSLGAALLLWLRPGTVASLRAHTSGKVVTSLQTWSVVHILLGIPFLEVSLAAVAVATLWALVDYSTLFRGALGASKSVSTP